MFVISFTTSLKYTLLAVTVLIGAIFFQIISFKYDSNEPDIPKKKTLFTPEELSAYDGTKDEKLYLAVMGNIYDVTSGSKHYGKGSSYSYFTGKDGTRALVTGNFKDESSDKDHILDLPCVDFLTIINWGKTFKQKYTFVGLLTGRYYDENGVETSYLSEVKQKVNKCRLDKEARKQELLMYPPCNVAWNEEDGVKVWCTKASGGVKRDWVGVPRQIYPPDNEKSRCVCVELDKVNINRLKEYDGCPSTATECKVIE